MAELLDSNGIMAQVVDDEQQEEEARELVVVDEVAPGG